MSSTLPHSGALPIGRLRAVLIGQSVPFAKPGATSAIAKYQVSCSLEIEQLGLRGDQQADLRVHGGPDKAIHAYSWDHYQFWKQQIPESPLWSTPGAFGENFSIEGLDESSVCIGDRWSAGSAILEISQGRQPCWKLNHRFGVADMSLRVQNSLRAGWYYRVIRCGSVAASETLELLERPHPGWSIERLLALIRDKSCDKDILSEVLRLPLPNSWRKLFTKRSELEIVEDWNSRLNGRFG